MINLTPLFRSHFLSRLQQQVRYIDHADAVQQGELVRLIEKASLTRFGRKYDFSSIRTYRQFASTLPLYSYEDLRPQIMRMVNGEKDVLWPGRCMNFAQSSGTSDGRSKYIPITRESLQWNHYQGSSDVVSHYLNLNPSSRIFSGKAFILGGSFANNLKLQRGVRVGDLSASLIENMNPPGQSGAHPRTAGGAHGGLEQETAPAGRCRHRPGRDQPERCAVVVPDGAARGAEEGGKDLHPRGVASSRSVLPRRYRL